MNANPVESLHTSLMPLLMQQAHTASTIPLMRCPSPACCTYIAHADAIHLQNPGRVKSLKLRLYLHLTTKCCSRHSAYVYVGVTQHSQGGPRRLSSWFSGLSSCICRRRKAIHCKLWSSETLRYRAVMGPVDSICAFKRGRSINDDGCVRKLGEKSEAKRSNRG